MDLSVIIVSYKGLDKLSLCLRSLRNIDSDKIKFEVIVVDNDPSGSEAELLLKDFEGYKLIKNELNGGYAYGVNKGSENATGKYLLILNPDTRINEEAMVKLLKTAEGDHHYYIVSCRQVKDSGKESKAYGDFPGFFPGSRRSASETNQGKGLNENITFPDWVSGSVMLIRREVFDNLGGFDEDYWMYYEDVDFCRRVRLSGGGIAFINDVEIVHNHGGSSRINTGVTAMTKTEVQVSRHVYIQKHFRGWRRCINHALIIADNLIPGALAAIAGLIFFMVPRLLVRLIIFLNLCSYYVSALFHWKWISRRSVNY